jgi:hypothetical protein
MDIIQQKFDNLNVTDNLDQFYTNPDIAEYCLNLLTNSCDFELFDKILEPSAGNGAFFDLLPVNKRVGIDIDPKQEDIVKMDFFDFVHIDNKTYIVVGNPPFGKNCSLAIKFFNKAAEFADLIAFIIPRTFKRISIQNKLNLNFSLILSEDLPMKPCCFNPKMSAKCCFQIWKKNNDEPRMKVLLNNINKDFTFLPLGDKDDKKQPTPPNNADFAIKAYGSNCGNIVTLNLDRLRPKSWHWIKSNIEIDTLIWRFNQLDFSISKDTVRQDSIGQKELIALYNDKFL